ncbi:MAG: hypothetical protein QOE29_2093, partial [Gaiellaceae bacterium]|nr:hypothetical protein [Gaiellaceae bacterium]
DPGLVPAITGLTRTLDAVAPGLLGAPVPARASAALELRATSYRGALYVVAVNAGVRPVTAQLSVRGLGERKLTVLDEARSVRARRGAFTETFPPLAARIYVAPPAWAR